MGKDLWAAGSAQLPPKSLRLSERSPPAYSLAVVVGPGGSLRSSRRRNANTATMGSGTAASPAWAVPLQNMIQSVTVYCMPIGKPRQTRADKWKRRDCVMRYRSFADEVRLAFKRTQKFPGAPLSFSWRAYFEMPASWSKKRKAEMAGQPHRQKPDRDNIDKAIMDSLFDDDAGVAFGSTAKYWDDGAGARIELELVWEAAQQAA